MSDATEYVYIDVTDTCEDTKPIHSRTRDSDLCEGHLMSNISVTSKMSSVRHVTPYNTRVVILGAGVAGLSAADHLIRHGFKNVVVLEAMDRIGGRAFTSHFGVHGDDIVEQGANWIHGGCAANSFFGLANQLDLLPGPLIPLERMDGYCYRSDGRAVDKSLSDKVFGMFSKWEDETPNFKNRPSLATYMRRRLLETLSTFDPDQREDVRCVFNCLMNYCQFTNGGFLENTAIPDASGYDDIPGGNIKVPCGMSTVLRGLVRNFPPGVVRLGRVADKINWDRYEVQVMAKDGTEHLAEHVICTLSLGYLKEHAGHMFNPLLPAVKQDAISIIPFGKVNKMFLQWEVPFWKKGQGSVKLAWLDNEAQINSAREWYKRIFAFDEVLNNSNVLVSWISGEEAEYMESLSENQVIATCTELLRKFLNNPSIPAPSRVLQTKWIGNLYTRGSYSYRSNDVEAHHIQDLIEPVKQGNMPRIMFAGEATDPHGFSTLHGARNSGLREAERLVAYYGLAGKSNL